MPLTHSVFIPQHPRKSQPFPAQPFVPQYHILILAWSALVILYGGPG
jgi:hypothetical protein